MKDSTDTTTDKGPATDFRTAFAALALEMEDEAHPEDDELVLYHEGGLPAERRSTVKEHLLTCRECFALIQDLRSFSEAERGAPEAPADFETAAFYRALRPRLGAIEGEKKGNRRNVLTALAAAFGAATLGLSLWAASQQQTITAQETLIAQLSGIQANVGVLSLRSGQRGAGAPEPEILSGLGETLVLTPELPPQATTYEVRILDAAGSVVRSVPDLKEDPGDATFTLWLPRGALPPGRYRVALYADGDVIEQYWVEVVRAAAPP